MRERFYRPELDALRFFAFLCVFCDHLPVRHEWFRLVRDAGAFGLCMFFLLSAYLIVTILLRERANSGTISLKAFAIRRMLRIWPLYFAVLFGTYFVGRFEPAIRIPGYAVLAFSFLLGNFYVGRHGWLPAAVNPLWSLSVEEQFYLAIPAIAGFGGKRGLRVACVVTVLASYGMLIWMGQHGATPILAVWSNSLVQFQFFAAGGLIALLIDQRRLSISFVLRLLLLAAGIALWFLAAVRFQLHSVAASNPRQLVGGYFVVIAGTVMIFLSVLDSRVRPPSIVLYLGKISYGLYLFHQFWLWLIFDNAEHWRWLHSIAAHEEAGAAIALGGTVMTAMLSYHFFEKPILRFKERFETIRTRPA